MVFRLEESVGISSLAGGWSSRACAGCLCAGLVPAFRSCRPAEVSGMWSHHCARAPATVLVLMPACSAVVMAPRHPHSPEPLPSSPLPLEQRQRIAGHHPSPLPALAAGVKEFPLPSWGISIYRAAKRLSAAAFGQTYFQIFSAAALYILWFSLMRYAGFSMATTEIAFFLKKQ